MLDLGTPIQGCGLRKPNAGPLTTTWLSWCVCTLYIASVERRVRETWETEVSVGKPCTTGMRIASAQEKGCHGAVRKDTLSLSTCLSPHVCGRTIPRTSYTLCCAYPSCILVLADRLIVGRCRSSPTLHITTVTRLLEEGDTVIRSFA